MQRKSKKPLHEHPQPTREVLTMLIRRSFSLQHANPALLSFARVGSRGLSSEAQDTRRRVVFLGTPEVSAQSLELFLKASLDARSNIQLVGVISQPPAPAGRKMKLTPSPVQMLAKRFGLPLLTPASAKDSEFLKELSSWKPDLCVTAAYGQFLPRSFLAIPKYGTLNIHPSLLPLYRGAAPVQRCLENGDEFIGVSIVETVLKMDAGPLVQQHKQPLDGSEKAPELLESLVVKGTEMLLDILQTYFVPSNLAGSHRHTDTSTSSGDDDVNDDNVEDSGRTKTAQDHDLASSANKIDAGEAHLDLAKMSALTIHNRARGFAGWPGVWSYFHVLPAGTIEDAGEIFSDEEALSALVPQRIKLTTTCVVNKQMISEHDFNKCEENWEVNEQSVHLSKVYPTVHAKRGKDALIMKCHDGTVLAVFEIQPAGKKVMDAKSFINGLRGQDLYWASKGNRKVKKKKFNY